MRKTGKARHGMQQNGKTERGKKKNERRKGTKERRQKINKEVGSTRLSRRSPGLMAPAPVIVLTGK